MLIYSHCLPDFGSVIITYQYITVFLIVPEQERVSGKLTMFGVRLLKRLLGGPDDTPVIFLSRTDFVLGDDVTIAVTFLHHIPIEC